MNEPLKLPVVYYSEYAEQQEKTNEMLGIDNKLSISDYEVLDGYFYDVSGITQHTGFIEPASTLYSGGAQNTIAMPIEELFQVIETWRKSQGVSKVKSLKQINEKKDELLARRDLITNGCHPDITTSEMIELANNIDVINGQIELLDWMAK